MYRIFFKRAFDVVFSALFLIIFSPVIAFVAVLVYLNLGSPIFFNPQRPGYKGKIFKMFKFRSMTNEKDENGNLLPNERRLTKFGRFLRKTSLDEFPEFLNVLRGEMSVIGPRPLAVSYLSRYTPEQARRHDVKPGITGYAQVRGRNSVTWEEKFAMDVWYVDHLSFWLDFKIFWSTIYKVIARESADTEDCKMGSFMGSASTRPADVPSGDKVPSDEVPSGDKVPNAEVPGADVPSADKAPSDDVPSGPDKVPSDDVPSGPDKTPSETATAKGGDSQNAERGEAAK